MGDFDLVTGYTPGVIGRVSELHSLYYFEHWGFNEYFEANKHFLIGVNINAI